MPKIVPVDLEGMGFIGSPLLDESVVVALLGGQAKMFRVEDDGVQFILLKGGLCSPSVNEKPKSVI